MPHLSNSATHKFVRESPKNGLSDNLKPHEKAAEKALRQHSAFSSPAHCTIAHARTTTAPANDRPQGNSRPTQPNGSRTGACPRSSAARATKLRMNQPPVALRAASIPADGAIPFRKPLPAVLRAGFDCRRNADGPPRQPIGRMRFRAEDRKRNRQPLRNRSPGKSTPLTRRNDRVSASPDHSRQSRRRQSEAAGNDRTAAHSAAQHPERDSAANTPSPPDQASTTQAPHHRPKQFRQR